MSRRRSWTPLYRYKCEYGPLDYDIPELRTDPRTCKWCHGKLRNKRQKSFCSPDCSADWSGHYVWGRNRPPVPWRILCRDHFACRRCGWASREVNEYGVEHFSAKGLDVHHIIPVADGGTDHESNLITLCTECHKEVHREMKAKSLAD